ncbi:MAG: hypoxanthine phosphoribosyltransferase [Chloroflexi bacterium]|nr:hypoxanthine phosphoribosyltransferase [Chloroflexota bacterium]
MEWIQREGTIAKVLIDTEMLAAKVAELGAAIDADYADRQPLLVGVLRGCAFFFADLMRHLTIPVAMDFIAVSSYGPSAGGSGAVRFMKDLDLPVEGRHVILVEDVIDTGLTLRYVVRNLKARHPASLEICTLLDKRVRRLVDTPLRYIGFDLPDVFVVGYGLDYQQRYRNLPFIAVLHKHVYDVE